MEERRKGKKEHARRREPGEEQEEAEDAAEASEGNRGPH